MRTNRHSRLSRILCALLAIAPSACTGQRETSAPEAPYETNLELRFVTLAGAPVAGAKVTFSIRSRSVPSALADSAEAFTPPAGAIYFRVSSGASGWYELRIAVAPAVNSGLQSVAVKDSVEWAVRPAPRRVVTVVVPPQ